jgi:hypothetical protein
MTIVVDWEICGVLLSGGLQLETALSAVCR